MKANLFYLTTSILVFGRATPAVREDDVRQSVLDSLGNRSIQLEDIKLSFRQYLFVKYKFDLTQGFLLLRMAEARDAECKTVVTKRNYVFTTCYFDISRSVAIYFVSPEQDASHNLKDFNASATVTKGSVQVSITLKPPGYKGYGDPLMVTVYVSAKSVNISHPPDIFGSSKVQKHFQRKARTYITKKIVETLEKALKNVEHRLREIWRNSTLQSSTDAPITTTTGERSSDVASTITKATTQEVSTTTTGTPPTDKNSTELTSSSTSINNC